jgi:hypothetical protein
MVNYFVSRSGIHTISNYLARAGKAHAHLIHVVPYDKVHERTAIARGTCIFAALDQLSDAQREVLPELADQLSRAGLRVLNDPRRVRLRYQLLRTLHASGQNVFTVYRPADVGQVRGFPVFVRDEHLHNGNLTPLLHDAGELQRALHGLMLRGRRLSDLLIVEFCDTSDAQGHFRKYSAFKMGDAIIPRYLEVSRHWMIKTETRVSDADALAEDRAYLETNSHECWLRDIFALAGIDYGRIDYAMLNGRPQVWEINTNPALGCSPPKPHARAQANSEELAALKAIFHQRYGNALVALADITGALVPIELTAEERRTLRLDARRARRHDRLAACVTQVVESSLVQAAKPWLKRAASSFAPVIAQIPRRS